jgi:hypothetical protein
MAQWGRNTGRINENATTTTHGVLHFFERLAVGGVVEHPLQTPFNAGARYQEQESKRLGHSGLRPAAETKGLGKHDLTGKYGGGAGLRGGLHAIRIDVRPRLIFQKQTREADSGSPGDGCVEGRQYKTVARWCGR